LINCSFRVPQIDLLKELKVIVIEILEDRLLSEILRIHLLNEVFEAAQAKFIEVGITSLIQECN
jgi:hypothetical protein